MRRFAGYIAIVATLIISVVFCLGSQVSSLNGGLEYGDGYEAVYRINFGEECTKTVDDIVDILTSRIEDAEVRNANIESVSDTDHEEYQVRVRANSENEESFEYVLRSMEATGKITVSAVLNEGEYSEIEDPFVRGSAKVQWNGSTPFVSVEIKNYDAFNSFVTSCNDAYKKFEEEYLSDQEDNENKIDGVIVVWLNKTDADSYLEAFENENDVIKESVKQKILSIIPTSYFQVIKDGNDKVTSANLLIDRYDFEQNIMVGPSAHTIERLLNYEPQDYSLTRLYVREVESTYNSNAMLLLLIGLGSAVLLLSVVMIIKYGLPGLSGGATTAFSLLISIFVFNFFSYPVTTMVILSFIIAIILNLLLVIPTLETFKDELYKGKTPIKANQEAFRATKISALDTLIVTLIVSVITIFVSINQVKLLPISITISMIVSYIVIRLLMRLQMWWLVTSKVGGNTKVYMVKGNDVPVVSKDETQTKFNFMNKFDAKKHGKIASIGALVVSGLCAVAILVLSLIPGVGTFNYSSEFKSTTRIEISTEVTSAKHLFETKQSVVDFFEKEFQMTPENVYINKIENVIDSNNQGDLPNRDDLPTIAYISVGFDQVYDFDVAKYETLVQKIQLLENGDNAVVYVGTTKSTIQNYILDYSVFTLITFTLIASVYYFFRYKFSYGLASLATALPPVVVTVAILAISRIPTSPIVLMGVAAGVFVGVLFQIPLFSRIKKLTRESKVKVTTYEQREEIALRANHDALHIVVKLGIASSVVVIIAACFAPVGLLTVFAGMLITMLLVLLLTCFLFTPVYLKIEKQFAQISKKRSAKKKEKRVDKGKKRLQKIRDAHKNVGSEPSESIIPGIND